ncbi:hypothetical protein OAI94_00355 [bacterium]|nr:hypothetical protein [bacterium]
MKITIGWNCWSNYEDVLLGSEILTQLNEQKIFEKLHIIAHSGYHKSPSVEQQKYLDKFYKIKTPLDNIKNINVNKILAPARIFNGFKIAYNHALENKCDYAIVTNADAWFLSLEKLKKLLSDTKVENCCISSRVGKLPFLFSEFSSEGLFYDDHFVIINVNKCRSHNVFDYANYRFEDCLYLGGIDYQISKFINIKIPEGMHHAYSDMSNCVNHYGIKCNSGLLPFTYEIEFDFMHANVAVDQFLHSLRAKILFEKSLNKMTYSKNYVTKHLSNKINYKIKNGLISFKIPIFSNIKLNFYLFARRLLYFFLKKTIYDKKNSVLKLYSKNYDPYKNYSKYIKIPPSKFTRISILK